MTDSARGKKHTCPACEAKFYDMGKSEIHCPKCGTEIVAVAPHKEIAIAVVLEPVKKASPIMEDIEIDMIDIDNDADTDDEIASLSELEDRDTGTIASPKDDTEAQELIDELQAFSTLVDDAGDAEKELTA